MKTTTAFLRFEEIKKLGAGAFGKVWEARDLQLNADFAVKKLRKSAPCPIANANLFAEVQHLHKCRHPNVVEIKYGCEDSDAIYFAMPLYRKGSLQDILDHRFFTVREVIDYGTGILNGLQYIHTQKFLHLDIKPANVIIDDNGQALLGDFGCARKLANNGFAEAGMMYFLHMAPESFVSEKMTIETDIYHVGLTLFRLLNGDRIFLTPINGKSQDEIKQKINKGKFPDRDLYLPHIPLRLKKAINKAIDVKPTNRFHSAADFNNALAGVNSCLDWQYTEAGNRTWTRVKDEGTVQSTIIDHGNKFTVDTVKTTKATSKPFHKKDFCGKNLTLEAAERLVTDLVRTLDKE